MRAISSARGTGGGRDATSSRSRDGENQPAVAIKGWMLRIPGPAAENTGVAPVKEATMHDRYHFIYDGPTAKIIEEVADQYAFLVRNLHMKATRK